MGQEHPAEGMPNTMLKQVGHIKVPIGFQIALILLVLIFGTTGAYKWLTQSQINFPTGVAVITGVQHISKLETVSMTIQQIIKYEADGNPIWKFFDNTKKLFVVYGNVVAGIDLSTLTISNVTIQKNDSTHESITLNLPAPQIFSTTVDPTKTIVYDISSGIFSPFNQGMDPNTTEQILAGAKQALQKEACQNDNILQQASNSAQIQLSSFLTTLGFTNATVTIAHGKC